MLSGILNWNWSNSSDAGNAPNGWKTWYIIFSLLIGFAFIGAFLFLESKVQHPLMPLAIWKVPQFGRVMLIIALGFGCFTGFLGFTWSLWFQQIDHASPITVLSNISVIDVDYLVLFTAICDGSRCQCCCCDDYASCRRNNIARGEYVLLYHLCRPRRNSTSWNDILGHVISGLGYFPFLCV